MGSRSDDAWWDDYLAAFHAARPGITTAVLSAATTSDGSTPYDWVAEALPRDGVVVDVACGGGPLATRIVRSWIGFDRSGFELARAAPVAAGRIVLADAAAAPVRSGGADVVVCSMALMVVDDPGVAVAEMARMLRVGGALVALLPATSPLTLRDRVRYVRLLAALRRRELPFRHHDVLRDPRRLVATAGLDVVAAGRRRFAYRVSSPDDAALLVSSLYLPDLKPGHLQAAHRVARRWVGSSIGLPFRRLVATKQR